MVDYFLIFLITYIGHDYFYKIYSDLRNAIMSEDLITLQNILNLNNFNIFYPIDMNGLTLLHYAVQQEKEKIVELFCIHMKDVDVRDFMGRTPLHYAVAKSNKNILKILLAAGADVNSPTIGGDTPLIKAISFNQPYSVKLLMRFGANSNILNKFNTSSKSLATKMNRLDSLKIIEEYEEIEKRLCFVIYIYLYIQKIQTNTANHKLFLSRLNPGQIKTLTRYIIP